MREFIWCVHSTEYLRYYIDIMDVTDKLRQFFEWISDLVGYF